MEMSNRAASASPASGASFCWGSPDDLDRRHAHRRICRQHGLQVGDARGRDVTLDLEELERVGRADVEALPLGFEALFLRLQRGARGLHALEVGLHLPRGVTHLRGDGLFEAVAEIGDYLLQFRGLEAVFERFWQVGKNDRRGLGLGLYISRCIVEAHGGSIEALSPGLGRGTTIRVRLPVKQPDSADTAET